MIVPGPRATGLTTRPRSERLARTRRTLPTQQCALRIFRFAAASRSPSTLGTRQRTEEAEARAAEAEAVVAEAAEAEAEAVVAEAEAAEAVEAEAVVAEVAVGRQGWCT